MNKKILFLILLLAVVALPQGAFAGSSQSGIQALDKVLENVGKAVQAIGSALIIVGFVVAGVMYLTSTGNDQKMGTARKALWASLIGAVIVILAYATTNIEAIIKQILGV